MKTAAIANTVCAIPFMAARVLFLVIAAALVLVGALILKAVEPGFVMFKKTEDEEE